MPELLTAKQVQDLLQLDRTTIYRMLDDGRLTGVKIGQQWRFDRDDIEALLEGKRPAPGARSATADRNVKPDVLPVHCVQRVQDVFADIAQIGAVTTRPDGTQLTEISNGCQFCAQILASESGRQACQASWRKLARQSERRPNFVSCHAGLQYARARIEIADELAAMLIAGQFYALPPDPDEETARLERLSLEHSLDLEALAHAARSLPVLDERTRSQIGVWLETVAHTFADIGHERAEFMTRLRTIAEMSAF